MTTPFDGYILQKTLPFLRTCSFCNAKRRSLYEVPIDGTVYLFCSVAEATQGIANYSKNTKLLKLKHTDLSERSEQEGELVSTSNEDNIR